MCPLSLLAGLGSGLLSLSGTAADDPEVMEAASFWNSVVTGYSDGVERPRVSVEVRWEALSGFGDAQVLGKHGSGNYAKSARVRLDPSRWATLSAGRREEVATHELAHALGFGQLWGPGPWGLGLVVDGDYTGARGIARYQFEYDRAGAPSVDGSGIHWETNTEILNQRGEPVLEEVMTGTLGFVEEWHVSLTTLGAMEDLGYVVQVPMEVAMINGEPAWTGPGVLFESVDLLAWVRSDGIPMGRRRYYRVQSEVVPDVEGWWLGQDDEPPRGGGGELLPPGVFW